MRTLVKQARFRSGGLETRDDLLVAQLPHKIALGHRLAVSGVSSLGFWAPQAHGARRQGWHGAARGPTPQNHHQQRLLEQMNKTNKLPPDKARSLRVEDMNRLGRGDPAAMVRPASKRERSWFLLGRHSRSYGKPQLEKDKATAKSTS